MTITIVTQRRIQPLPPLIVNQLAAGEVVTRPASVVKELIDNALDAGATQIDIRVTEGGMGLIEVKDNGVGIHRDDLALAVSRYATSKVADIATMQGIHTFGFRGEALAAIAAVSRLTISSSQDDSGIGHQLHVVGIINDATPPTPLPHPRGSTIQVRDLFFNLPARRKPLKSLAVEWGYIETVVKEAALAHATVCFSLWHNGQRRYHLPAISSAANDAMDFTLIKQRMEQVFAVKFTPMPTLDNVEHFVVKDELGDVDGGYHVQGMSILPINMALDALIEPRGIGTVDKSNCVKTSQVTLNYPNSCKANAGSGYGITGYLILDETVAQHSPLMSYATGQSDISQDALQQFMQQFMQPSPQRAPSHRIQNTIDPATQNHARSLSTSLNSLYGQKLTYINGRMIKEPQLAYALRRYADRGLVGYVLFFHLPVTWLDVNVHPTKQRIGIDRLPNVLAHLQHGVSQRLLIWSELMAASKNMQIHRSECIVLTDNGMGVGKESQGKENALAQEYADNNLLLTHVVQERIQHYQSSYSDASLSANTDLTASSELTASNELSASIDSTTNDSLIDLQTAKESQDTPWLAVRCLSLLPVPSMQSGSGAQSSVYILASGEWMWWITESSLELLLQRLRVDIDVALTDTAIANPTFDDDPANELLSRKLRVLTVNKVLQQLTPSEQSQLLLGLTKMSLKTINLTVLTQSLIC